MLWRNIGSYIQVFKVTDSPKTVIISDASIWDVKGHWTLLKMVVLGDLLWYECRIVLKLDRIKIWIKK